jgi:hypothetical protein
VKVKVKVCLLSSNEFVETLPNKIPGYATAAAQYFKQNDAEFQNF